MFYYDSFNITTFGLVPINGIKRLLLCHSTIFQPEDGQIIPFRIILFPISMGRFHLLTNFGAACLKRGEESSKFPLCNFLQYFFLTQHRGKFSITFLFLPVSARWNPSIRMTLNICWLQLFLDYRGGCYKHFWTPSLGV